MRIKNRVKLYKDRDLSRIEVFSGDDRKYDESISFLLKCLCRAAKGNNVFVAYFGNNPELEAPDNAIEIKAWKEGSPHKMLWMRETWLSLTNKKFTEEFYSTFYYNMFGEFFGNQSKN